MTEIDEFSMVYAFCFLKGICEKKLFNLARISKKTTNTVILKSLFLTLKDQCENLTLVIIVYNIKNNIKHC